MAIALWFEHNPQRGYVAIDNFFASGDDYAALEREICDLDDPSLLYSYLLYNGWDFAYYSDDEAAKIFSPSAYKARVNLLKLPEMARRIQVCKENRGE